MEKKKDWKKLEQNNRKYFYCQYSYFPRGKLGSITRSTRYLSLCNLYTLVGNTIKVVGSIIIYILFVLVINIL